MDVLIVSQNPKIRSDVQQTITHCGHRWKEATSAVLTPFIIKEMGHSFDLIIIVGELNGIDPIQLVKNIRIEGIATPAYIVLSDRSDLTEEHDQSLGICIKTPEWLHNNGLADLLDHLSGKSRDNRSIL